MRSVQGDNEILDDGIPHIAFIGRSNAGKSSLINSLTGVKNLAISGKTPGRTQSINVFLINGSHYFLDLPGYGFTKRDAGTHEQFGKLIYWYLFDSKHTQKVVLIVDAEIGPTDSDIAMLEDLVRAHKDIIIVLNKVDKIKKSQYKHHIEKIASRLSPHKIFVHSAISKVGKQELIDQLLG